METVSTEKSNDYRAILFGGLLAGAMDLTAAFINGGVQGADPMRVLRGIASGLLGADGANGGAAASGLSVLLHFTIAFVWTTVFYLASRKIKFLTAQPVVSGILYGVVVYLVMYLVVVPLSAFPYKMSFTPQSIVTNVIIHIICVGLPIALVVRRFSR